MHAVNFIKRNGCSSGSEFFGFFCKNSVKTTDYVLTKLLFIERWFKLSVNLTVWKLREITLTHFWKKFCESNGFTKEITK